MLVTNSAQAGFILGTLNKNINKKSKASSQLALGEKIRHAGDDASGYAISEKMRVRIRSLNQADANVQNGASMLRVAEGAIQSQINLLRTVKERVINAHNDTNTDTDRMIIQKEISQYYSEINDIAAETTFNGKQLLLGNKVSESVKGWYRLDHAEKLEGSDTLGLISGTIETLDGQEGPFKTFGAATDDVAFDGYNIKTLSTESMSGGSDDVSNVISIRFSAYTSDSDLENRAFKILYPSGEEIFVFAHGTSHSYRGDNVHIVDLDSDSALERIIKKMNQEISNLLQLDYSSSSSFMKLTLTTRMAGAITNDTSLYNIEGTTLAGGDGYTAASSLTDLPTSRVEITNSQSGKDGATAGWTWDLSGYDTAESFIAQYVGQAIYHSGNSQYYEFIDSSTSPTTDSITKINGSTVIDLNSLRSSVSSGKSVAEAMTSLLSSKMGSSLVSSVTDSSGNVTGVKLNATVRGTEGNSQTISFKQGDLRDYTVDFQSLLSGVSGADIPGKLDGQGFRFYDATDKNKWV
ncbi:flagellin, partial [Anaerovibrio sp.]|uniref:flagellin n=1 Tax=Anaerovibrio sp. TaxID=1872532 RepID=UPI0025E4D3BF